MTKLLLIGPASLVLVCQHTLYDRAIRGGGVQSDKDRERIFTIGQVLGDDSFRSDYVGREHVLAVILKVAIPSIVAVRERLLRLSGWATYPKLDISSSLSWDPLISCPTSLKSAPVFKEAQSLYADSAESWSG